MNNTRSDAEIRLDIATFTEGMTGPVEPGRHVAEAGFRLAGDAAWLMKARDAAEARLREVEAAVRRVEQTAYGDQSGGAWQVLDEVRAALSSVPDAGPGSGKDNNR